MSHSWAVNLGFALAEIAVAWGCWWVYTQPDDTCATLAPEQLTLLQNGQLQTLRYQEIKGFREQFDKNSTWTQVEPLAAGGPTIRLGNDLQDYDRLRQELAARVPDLDAAERERHEQALAAATQVLLQDTALGPTPNARQTLLDQASRTISRLTLLAVPLALWLLVGWPYELVMALGLALPLLAVAALWRYRGVAQFLSGRDDPRPAVVVAVALPSVVLAVRNLPKFDFMAWAPLWPAAASAGGALALLLLGSSWSATSGASPLKQVGMALVLALCYGLGASIVYNCALGGSYSTLHLSQVADKYETRGKGASSYLVLATRGAAETSWRLAVSSGYYARKQPGDTVTVRLHHGRLGANWAELPGDE